MDQRPALFDFCPEDARRDGAGADSGIWALTTVAAHHQVRVDFGAYHDLGLPHRLATTADLLSAARAAGLHAKQLECQDLRGLQRTARPIILRMRDGRYTVLGHGIESEYELFHCDSFGATHHSAKELRDDWSGEMILVTGRNKTETASDREERFGLGWLTKAVWRHRNTLLQILAATVFVQLLMLATPVFFQVVIDKVLVHNSLATLFVAAVGMCVFGVFGAFLTYLRNYAIAYISSHLDVELNHHVFVHLLRLPLSYFEKNPAGQILTRMRELDGVRNFLTNQGFTSLLDAVFTVFLIVFLCVYSLRLALIVLVSIPLYIGVAIITRLQLLRKMAERYTRFADTQQYLVEAIGGIHTLKSASVESVAQAQWDEKRAAFADTTFRSTMLGAALQSYTQYISIISTATVLVFGARAVISGEMTIGALVAFNMISAQIVQPIVRLSQLWQDLQQVLVSLTQVRAIMDAVPESGQSLHAGLTAISGSISFRNVGFRYADTAAEVIEDLCLEIPAGQVIGIVGSSGSGKSTLVKLIQRHCVPQRGQVLVDGLDVRKVHPSWLRRQIGVVLQDTLLFNRTVHENIALAAPYSTREHVIAVARLAGADEFIARLPEGYDTRIEERGINLSGGQRQRIAIARALANNPRILILDEATSSVDYESERIIRTNLREMVRNRTVILIAHRLATVRDCDRIIGLANGKIVEDGTHEELLRHERGLYRQLWSLQQNLATTEKAL